MICPYCGSDAVEKADESLLVLICIACQFIYEKNWPNFALELAIKEYEDYQDEDATPPQVHCLSASIDVSRTVQDRA